MKDQAQQKEFVYQKVKTSNDDDQTQNDIPCNLKSIMNNFNIIPQMQLVFSFSQQPTQMWNYEFKWGINRIMHQDLYAIFKQLTLVYSGISVNIYQNALSKHSTFNYLFVGWQIDNLQKQHYKWIKIYEIVTEIRNKICQKQGLFQHVQKFVNSWEKINIPTMIIRLAVKIKPNRCYECYAIYDNQQQRKAASNIFILQDKKNT